MNIPQGGFSCLLFQVKLELEFGKMDFVEQGKPANPEENRRDEN